MSSARPYERIAFVASANAEAAEAHTKLCATYGDADPAQADAIVALGGDGFMLRTLHRFMASGKPIYGMHRGTVGFLLTEYRADGLGERLAAAPNTGHLPVPRRAGDDPGKTPEAHAFNEVSLFRQTNQAAHLR